jgi:hypothetical protein
MAERRSYLRFIIGDKVFVRTGELRLGPGTVMKKKPEERIYFVSMGNGTFMWVHEDRLMTVQEASREVIKPSHD